MQKIFFFLFFGFFSLSSPIQAQTMLDPSDYTPTACGSAQGTCSSNDANCYALGGGAGIQYDLIGYCDAAQTTSCCKIKNTSTGPGTDDYCINTQKGTCYNQQQGCKNGGLIVGDCSTIANINSPRICCSNPVQGGATLARGAFSYTLLEEIPNSSGTSGDFASYLQALYKFTFWAIGIAALFMLTVGGFMYITSAGNTSRISTAKTVIVDSILGIIIALFAWLFLYVLNPDLVEGLALPTTTPVVVTGEATTGGTGGTSGSGTQSLAQQILATGSGISLSGSGSCSSASGAVSPHLNIKQVAAGTAITRCQNGCPGTGLCTQTVNISDSMLRAMLQVAKKYPFTVTSIAGGSHCEVGVAGCQGLSAHYRGAGADISTGNKADWPNIVRAFREAGSDTGQTFCDKGGKRVDCNSADHIHVAF